MQPLEPDPRPPLDHPDLYHPDLFADRIPDITWMQDQVWRLVRGPQLRKRTIVYWGARGCGKSWFLLHLAGERYTPPGGVAGPTGCQLAVDGSVRSLYVDLSHCSADSAPPDEAVCHLLGAVGHHLAGWLGRPVTGCGLPDVSLAERSEWLLGDVEDLLGGARFVLLLDHVSEQPKTFLDELATRVLARLADTDHILLVMAERGRGHVWKDASLRWYVENRDLPAFGVEETGEQLHRLQAATVAADRLWQQTSGSPLANSLLARKQTLDDALGRMLAGVKEADRELLRAVSVLRFFRDEYLPDIQAAYYDQPDLRNQADLETQRQRKAMLDTGLVRWDNGQQAYVLDPAVRPLLDRLLMEKDLERWKRLQYGALRMFERLQQTVPHAAARWQTEVNYHACQLGKGVDHDAPGPNSDPQPMEGDSK